MGGSQGATLVVAFSFCPKILGRWWGPVNDICLFARAVSVVITLIGGTDTRNLSAIIRIHLNFLHSGSVGMLSHPHSLWSPRTLALKLRSKTVTT